MTVPGSPARTSLLLLLAFLASLALAQLLAILPGEPSTTSATFPGTNGKIAFEEGFDIFVMEADGSNPVNLTDSPANEHCPAWSPDGTRIAFDRDGDIWVMDADGSNQANLTNNSIEEADPTWSPDGTRIAFGSGPGDGRDWGLYVMNSDGSEVTFLVATKSVGFCGSPSWSPDGSRIAFGDGPHIINADGTNLVKLPGDNPAGTAPSWSPDGNCIVYQTYWGDPAVEAEIYVASVDGTRGANLSRNPANDENAAWSPDGTKIVFNSARDGNQEVYVMDADGGNQTRLTNTPRAELFPDWQPLPGAADPAPCVIPELPPEPSPSPPATPGPEPAPDLLPQGGGPPSAGADALPNAALIALGTLAIASAAYMLARISRTRL